MRCIAARVDAPFCQRYARHSKLLADQLVAAECGDRLPKAPVDLVADEMNARIEQHDVHATGMRAASGKLVVTAPGFVGGGTGCIVGAQAQASEILHRSVGRLAVDVKHAASEMK